MSNDSIYTERYIKCEGARGLVVFIHGFMGSPRHFYELMGQIGDNGYSVLTVLLPGHGGTREEFSRCRASHWRSHIARILEQCTERYDKVFLIGHSMGGLLSLEAAAAPGSGITAVIPIFAPMRIRLSGSMSFFSRAKIMRREPGDALRKSYEECRSIPTRPFQSVSYIRRPLGQLFKVMHESRAMLPLVTAPVLVIHSEHDETVDIKSSDIILSGLTGCKAEKLLVHSSWHAWLSEDDRSDMLVAILEFLGRYS